MSNAVAVRPGEAFDVMGIVRELMQRPDFSIDMLKELLALRQQAEQRQSDRDFQLAFARCQGNVTAAKRDKPNPLFQSRYATIESMYAAVWPAVMDEGFDWTVSAMPLAPEGWDNSVLWFQGTLSKDISKRTVELPVSRDALKPEGPKGNRPAMTSTQALGALTTYMRKYLLGIMFSVVTAEDVKLDRDGNPPRDRPPGGGRKGADPLDEQDPQKWIRNFDAAVRGAQSQEEVTSLEADPRIVEVYEHKATDSLKDHMDDRFSEARARIAKAAQPPPTPPADEDRREQINREVPMDKPPVRDPIPDPSLDALGGLIAEVNAMDLITLAGLQTNAQWRQKIIEAELFPPDVDTLNEAIDARKAALQQGRGS